MSGNFKVIEYEELEQEPGTLDDVVGLDEFKRFLADLKTIDNNPDKFANLPKPKGIIFCGPPGTGKTLVAKKVAKFLGYNYMPVSPSQLTSPLPAITTRKIQQAFDIGRSQSRNTVMFIDEIDGLIKDRAKGESDAGGALQKFLEVLDGTDNKDSTNLLVIVATNYVENLDAAFTRPGRFDEKVYFSLPGYNERVDMILKELVEDAQYVDIQLCADLTDQFSYAEIKEFVRRARVRAKVDNRQIDDMVILMALLSIKSGSSSNTVSQNPVVSKQLIPHVTGHTMGYIFSPESFTLGTSVEGVEIFCKPSLTKHRVKTQRDLVCELIAIIWALIHEVYVTGQSSSLAIQDNPRAIELIDQILTMMGADYGVHVNRTRLRPQLASSLFEFVIRIANLDMIRNLADSVQNEYTKLGIVTRKKLKELMNRNNITERITEELYSKLQSLIQHNLNIGIMSASNAIKNTEANKQANTPQQNTRNQPNKRKSKAKAKETQNQKLSGNEQNPKLAGSEQGQKLYSSEQIKQLYGHEQIQKLAGSEQSQKLVDNEFNIPIASEQFTLLV